MTKPWEETWRLDEANPVVRLHDNEPIAEFDGDEDLGDSEQNYARDVARARLAACAPELARMLLAREFSGREEDCNECLAGTCEEHAPDCAWLLLMKKAGIR